MKHQLLYEQSWEKTIAPRDRKQIEELFYNYYPPKPNTIQFIPYRVAINHYGDLLATALIQNTTNKNFLLDNVKVKYGEENRGVIAEKWFNIKQINVKSHTSMPWTLYFENDVVIKRPLLSKWYIIL